MVMTIGSLFSGFGALDLAAEEVFGATTAWVSDIDPGACKVLAHRFPHAPNLGDITAINWATVEPVDIITGGYPCQPFSTAGLRMGQDDDRHLWPHVRDALAIMRPRLVVFENVRGHLSLGFDEVVRDLHQLGYDIQWRLVRASDVGACHQRARLFILGVNREQRVCSRPDRRRGLHRDSSDGWELSGPTQGEHVRQGAPSASHTGEAVRRPREAGQECDGADSSLAHLGAHGRGGSDRDSQAPSAISDQRGRGGRGPGVRSDAHRVTQAAEPRSSLDRGDARTCRDAETAHPGGESTRPGPGAAGSAGHCPDCGVSLGVVVGAGGQLVRPGGVRGEVPNEREDDLGPRVRAASGADVLAERRDAAADSARDRRHEGRAESARQQGRPAAAECGHVPGGLTLLPTPRSSDSNGAGAHGTGGMDLRTAIDLLPTPSVADAMGGHERRGGKRGDELLLKGIATHERFGQYAPAIARQEQAFGYPAPSPTEPGKNGRPRLSAAFASWMMGAPPGWITDTPGVTRIEALRMAGNGVVRQQAIAALLDMRAATRQEQAA